MSFADVKPLPPPTAPPGSGGAAPSSWNTLPVDPAVASVLQFMPSRTIGGVNVPAGIYWHDLSNFVRGFVSQYAMRNSYAADPSAFEVGMSAFVSDDDTTWRLDKKSVPPQGTDWVEINEGMQIKLWTPDKSWKRGDVALVPWLPIFYRNQDLNIFKPGNAAHINADTYSVWVAQDNIDKTTPAEIGHAWLACNVPPGMYVTDGAITHKTVSWVRVGHSTNTYVADTLAASIIFGLFTSPQIFAKGDRVIVVKSIVAGEPNNPVWIGKVFQFDGSPDHTGNPIGAPETSTAVVFQTGWRAVAAFDVSTIPDGIDDDDRLSWDATGGKWTTATNELGSQVNINTLADGEVLVYDDTNNEWNSEAAVLTKDTHTIIGGTPANPSGVI